jgi:hypothetical protein
MSVAEKIDRMSMRCKMARTCERRWVHEQRESVVHQEFSEVVVYPCPSSARDGVSPTADACKWDFLLFDASASRPPPDSILVVHEVSFISRKHATALILDGRFF